jgi:hypothetical protein
MRLVPVWVWWAIIAALAALAGVEHLRANRHKTKFAEFRAEVAVANQLAADLARLEEQRKQAAANEEAEHARQETEALQSDVVRLAGIADGLRDAVEAERKRRAAARSCPPVRSKSEPGAASPDLLADVYLGLVEAARATSDYADRIEIAGGACERTADKVRTTSGVLPK